MGYDKTAVTQRSEIKQSHNCRSEVQQNSRHTEIRDKTEVTTVVLGYDKTAVTQRSEIKQRYHGRGKDRLQVTWSEVGQSRSHMIRGRTKQRSHGQR